MTVDPPEIAALRQDIDAIDDQLLDLLTRRDEVAARIGAAKPGGPVIRPGREAMIVRRIVERWQGRIDRRTIVRIWREILSGVVASQGPFSMAVWMPERGAGYLEVARQQYGAHTPATSHQSAMQVVREVVNGGATVGVLPQPRWEDESPWWPQLLSAAPDTPHIVARLPFTGPGPLGIEALVIARAPAGKTGDDRSVLAVETAAELSRSAFTAALNDAGMPFRGLWDARALGDTGHVHLVEVQDYVDRTDPRLGALDTGDGGPIRHVRLLGGYASPLAAETLTP